MKNFFWFLKMVWYYGISDAIIINRVNEEAQEAYRKGDTATDHACMEYLETFEGDGWFGLVKN